MLVQLGNDATGHSYVNYFKEHGVNTEYVRLLDGEDTGKVTLNHHL